MAIEVDNDRVDWYKVSEIVNLVDFLEENYPFGNGKKRQYLEWYEKKSGLYKYQTQIAHNMPGSLMISFGKFDIKKLKKQSETWMWYDFGTKRGGLLLQLVQYLKGACPLDMAQDIVIKYMQEKGIEVPFLEVPERNFLQESIQKGIKTAKKEYGFEESEEDKRLSPVLERKAL